jgi:hypothetical protein
MRQSKNPQTTARSFSQPQRIRNDPGLRHAHTHRTQGKQMTATPRTAEPKRASPRSETPAGRADEILLAREVGAAIARRVLGSTVIGGMLAASGIAIFLIPVTFYVVERLATGRKSVKPEKTVPPAAQPTTVS